MMMFHIWCILHLHELPRFGERHAREAHTHKKHTAGHALYGIVTTKTSVANLDTGVCKKSMPIEPSVCTRTLQQMNECARLLLMEIESNRVLIGLNTDTICTQ